MKFRHVVANLCFFLGLPLLTLWSLYVLFLVFFWTGMGLRFSPPPPASVYWKEFFRTLCFFLSSAKLSSITCSLATAVVFGWHERRKHKNA